MTDTVPQFATAEYSGKPGETTCKGCGQVIAGPYYQVNGTRACAGCAERIKDQMPKDSHAAFGRGVLFGAGGAVLGLAIYVGFALTTGLIAGIISLAVGFLVGKAIVTGSGGVGGRRYQVAAVLLTYIAVSLAAIPIALSQHLKQKNAQAQTQAGEHPVARTTTMSPGKALGMLTLIGLVSPFLALSNPMQGVIGLVILFVGIRIAWRMTAAKQVRIVGPFTDPIPATPV